MTKSEFLSESPIFCGLSSENAEHLFARLSAHSKTYERNQAIVRQGQEFGGVGAIVSGRVFEKKCGANGNCEIVSVLKKNEIFGEKAIFEKNAVSESEFFAQTRCEIFFLHFAHLSAICANECIFLSQLMKNLANLLAKKNESAEKRIFLLSQRTICAKILCALDFFADERGKIPFNISEFADFLCVDRAAMSRELRKLANEKKLVYSNSEVARISQFYC